MATIEELQAQLAALTARVDVITTPPETYYTMQYQGETIDRLLSMAPDNLLDNVNFCNPVNQRSVSGTISTPGFFIDRWKLISGTAQLTAAGIILNGTMQQTREFSVGYATTASALTTTGVVSATYDDSTKIFTLTGTGQTFITAKLELGNVSTVGYQNSGGVWVPTNVPPYSAELAKCQRFLLLAESGILESLTMTVGFAVLPTPVTMRANPIIIGGVSAYSFNGNSIISGATVSVYSLMSNGVLLAIGATNEPAYVYFTPGTGLSCEI